MMRATIRTFAKPDCLLCGSAGEFLHQALDDRLFRVEGSWNLRQCPDPECRLAWLDPMPVAEDFDKLYGSYFTHTCNANLDESADGGILAAITNGILAQRYGYPEKAPNVAAGVLARLAGSSRFLRECIGMSVSWLSGENRGRLIDVGSGSGEFLAHMRDLRWDVVGVEPDPRAAQLARDTYGLTIYTGSLEQAGLAPQSFDAMTLNHVIEHLPDPLATLRAARNLLRPGARFVILTPNVTSFAHRWFRDYWRGLEPPRHLFLFSQESLERIVKMAGFEVMESRKNAVSADAIWRLSLAAKQKLDLHTLPRGYARFRGFSFMMFEHAMTGRPFCRPWGEQLALLAGRD